MTARLIPFRKLGKVRQEAIAEDVDLLEQALLAKFSTDDAREQTGGLWTFSGRQTGNYTARAWEVVDMSVAAAGLYVRLPSATAAANVGSEVLLMNSADSAATVYVIAIDRGTIGGDSVVYLYTGEQMRLKSDGRQWRRIGG